MRPSRANIHGIRSSVVVVRARACALLVWTVVLQVRVTHRCEIVEMLRKLALISVLAATSAKSTTYLYSAHVVSFFTLSFFAYTRPFVEPSADRLQFATLAVTTLSIFYGIMLKAPDGGVGSGIDSNERTAKVTHPSKPSRNRTRGAGAAVWSAGYSPSHHERVGLRAAARSTLARLPQTAISCSWQGDRLHPWHPTEAWRPLRPLRSCSGPAHSEPHRAGKRAWRQRCLLFCSCFGTLGCCLIVCCSAKAPRIYYDWGSQCPALPTDDGPFNQGAEEVRLSPCR